jgi:hypothetical protein
MASKHKSTNPGSGHDPASAPNAPTESETQGWDYNTHDPPPDVSFVLPSLDTHTYLMAFLRAENARFSDPYQEIRDNIQEIIDQGEARPTTGQKPKADVGPSRLRTWLVAFERFGFLYNDSEKGITLTRLGRAARDLYAEVNRAVDSSNGKLAALAVKTLGRQLLRNPLETAKYPEGTDIMPFRFIWNAMRQLENRLHPEEMNRVIMRTLYRADEQKAIDHIRAVRAAHGGVYNSDAAVNALGLPRVPIDEETVRRISPWFARAGFGGLILEPENRPDTYRHLVDEESRLALIDAELREPVAVPAPDVATDEAAYLQYLSDGIPTPTVRTTEKEAAKVREIQAAVERYGRSKIIALAGIPGTGKSHLAKLVALALTEHDPYRFAEIQFHESTSYDDFMEGFVPRPGGQGFELMPKTFRLINDRAHLDTAERRYVLLIEEFTRANVHSVLGELITYIEHRNRPFRLPLSQKEERIAPNLVILATMNPRDKSALVLDQAILRRLHQIDIPPSVEGLRMVLRDNDDEAARMEVETYDRLEAWFVAHLTVLPFGHAVFAGAGNGADLHELWRGTLRHFLLDSAGEIREAYRPLASAFPWAQ